MGMKLMSPFQNKDQQQSELTRKILRIQETEKLAEITNAKLARAEADFSSMMARNQAKWAQEEEEHMKLMKDREQEVNTLENRKQQALIPIEVYKKQADVLIEEAQGFVARAKEKEEKADELLENLEEKLTSVSDREFIVARDEEKLKIAKEGIKSQQESTKKGVEQLSKAMIEFHEKQKLDEASLLQRQKEVTMAEISFNAKVEKYKRDLEALRILEAQIKDERATLDREYKRRK